MSFQLQLLKYQSEAEEIIRDTAYEIKNSRNGEFRLVDSSLGRVSAVRFPYVEDTVKLNRAHLNHLLTTLSDWTESDCLQAQEDIRSGSEFDLNLDENSPKRYELYTFYSIYKLCDIYLDWPILWNFCLLKTKVKAR